MSGPEARLERACVRIAETRCRAWALKLWPLVTGLPDRLFLIPGGRVWLVEFKAPDGLISKRQHVVHARLRDMGFDVSVVRNKDDFIYLLRSRAVML